MRDLILGLLDTSEKIEEPWVADATRGLTLDYSRFKYFGDVLENASLGKLLENAARLGYRWCFVQAYGHIMTEIWRADGRDALSVLKDWRERAENQEVLAASWPTSAVEGASCLLVNLERWQAEGRPDLCGADVAVLPDELGLYTLSLRPEDPVAREILKNSLRQGISNFEGDRTAGLEPNASRFLTQVRQLVENLPRGVFPLNVEGYDDVDEAPPMSGPVRRLYSVAAGFKPNRILETHGFDDKTRVVFFDYSKPGLRFRRLLLDEWNGADYPNFLRRLFKLLPPSEAYYYLWQDAGPENVNWDTVAQRWDEELDAWGGAQVFSDHWQRYRRLPHEMIHNDLFGDRTALHEAMRDEPNSVVWWSNAFFSAVSNWFYSSAERRDVYQGWLDELAERMPNAWLYGSSNDNVSVNGVQALEYRDWFQQSGGDELTPAKRHRREIRF